MKSTGLIVDNFAGAGGASVGIESAMGRKVDYAINHDPEAIETHVANHPNTKHLIEDVFDVDPRELCAGRPVDLAWFSPDCTHHSRAKGGKPRDNKRRGLAWVVIRWAATVRPKVIMLENVPEFQTWGPLNSDGQPCKRRTGETFRSWVGELRQLGYDVQWRELVAADYGAPTIRKRLFLVARCDGEPIRWPTPTHAPRHKAVVLGLEPWRSAADCIDWSLPMLSIFATPDEAKEWARANGVSAPRRPLADATLRRIARGVMRFVVESDDPFVVTYAQHGGSSRSPSEPMHTITASGKDQNCIAVPTLIQTGHGERKGQKPRSLDIHAPLGTCVAGGCKHGLVSAMLSKHNGKTTGQRASDPLHTIAGNINKSLVACSLEKMRGTGRGGSLREPAPTQTAGGNHAGLVCAFLQKYYGSTKDGAPMDSPMHTVSCTDRFGLVTVAGHDYMIGDISMRMLQPHELLKAQFGRFASGYTLLGTKRRQVSSVGNSVCPEVAYALVSANFLRNNVSSHVGIHADAKSPTAKQVIS
jgi:DNA (cytosine-5)-methyltransferase 1